MSYISVDRIITVIPSGSQSASAVHLRGRQLIGVDFPGALTGTALSFKVGVAETDTLRNLVSAVTVYQQPVTASAYSWFFAPEAFLGFNIVQIWVTGTAQGTAQTANLLVRPI